MSVCVVFFVYAVIYPNKMIAPEKSARLRSIYNCAINNCTNDPADDNFGFYYGNFNIPIKFELRFNPF